MQLMLDGLVFPRKLAWKRECVGRNGTVHGAISHMVSGYSVSLMLWKLHCLDDSFPTHTLNYLMCFIENHCHKKNFEIVQNDLNDCDTKTDTPEECQHLCHQVSGCYHFTWLSRNYKEGSQANMCCMKKEFSPPEVFTYGAVSGPKYCKSKM